MARTNQIGTQAKGAYLANFNFKKYRTFQQAINIKSCFFSQPPSLRNADIVAIYFKLEISFSPTCVHATTAFYTVIPLTPACAPSTTKICLKKKSTRAIMRQEYKNIMVRYSDISGALSIFFVAGNCCGFQAAPAACIYQHGLVSIISQYNLVSEAYMALHLAFSQVESQYHHHINYQLSGPVGPTVTALVLFFLVCVYIAESFYKRSASIVLKRFIKF